MENKNRNQQWFNASPVQKRMFVIHTLQPESTSYNVTTVFTIQGKYEEEKLLEAFRKCVKSNKMFQATFQLIHGELQYTMIEDDVEMEIIRKKKMQSLEEFKEEAAKEFVKPFEMIGGVLYRIRAAFYDEEHAFFYVDCHHSIFDGNCVRILGRDLKSAYELGQVSEKTEYSCFTKWQEENQKSVSYEEKKKFWRELFLEPSELCDFLEDNKMEQLKTAKTTGAKQMRIPSFDKKIISDFCKENQISGYSFFVSVLNLVTARMSYQKDVTIGTVASGRTKEQFKDTIGMFVNTFPLRNRLNEQNTVLQYVKEIHQSTRRALKNSDVQYDEIAELAGCSQERPLFQILLRYQQSYQDMLNIEGLTCLTEELLPEDSTFPFEILVEESEKCFDVKAYYAADVYKEETISIFLNQVKLVIEKLITNKEQKIADIAFIQEEEKQRILQEFNDTKREYPRDSSVSTVMSEVFSKYKDKKAVVFRNDFLTYEELDRKSNVLAHKLRDLGVKPDDYVGILAQKSIEMLIGVCAIIKAGGAYMPINPDYPKERIEFLIKDSGCKAVLIYQADYETDITSISMEEAEVWEGNAEPLENVNCPMDSIYLMYTSGTTGNPKGVMVCHRNVMRLVKNTNFMQFGPQTKILQTGSLSFDASTLEIWGALLNGGTLYLADKELIVSPIDIKELIEQYQINAMFMTTSLFHQMVNYDSGMFSQLEYILFGGEKASRECIRKLNSDPRNKGVKIINGYGPTEATTFSTTYQCDDITGFARVPIGKILANSTAYIMKENQLCGIGIPGELMLGGDGISKGYLNRDDLNKEKFVKNPYGEGMLYRSGDLAKWLPDGNIDYLGRMDEQVKIRGFRIELGEIESRLDELEEIKDAAVIVREKADGEKTLCAYVTSNNTLDISVLREKLRSMMPEFMVPAYMMQIQTIPVTKNGKLDRRALPAIALTHTSEYVAPRNETEEHICIVMKEILGMNQVSMEDGFFELGGDSIKAIRIVSKMRDFGYDISVRDIMNAKKIEDIASAAVKEEREQYSQEIVTGKVKETPIVRLFQDWKLAKPNHFNQALMLETDVEEDVIIRALEELAKHHDMLRAVYENDSLRIRAVEEGNLIDVIVKDVSECEEEEKAVKDISDQIQSGIDLEKGPLIRIAVFRESLKKKVLICIHHLIMDGVSWRILIDDLERAITDIQKEKEVILPKKTASFQEWANYLEHYQESESLKAEASYWEQVLQQMPKGKLNLEKLNKNRTFDTLHMVLSKEETDALLYQTSKAYHTEINDLLLSALGMAVQKLTGQKRVSVVLEGHGREELDRKIAIDRTIGWFTSMYPVVLSISENVSEMIVNTKESLRKIPNHGIGFGLLHALSSMDADIYFNYLGKMDGSQKKEGFQLISSFLYGNCVARENGQPGDIDLNGVIEEEKLDFAITYHQGKYRKKDMETFACCLKESLLTVIQYCANQTESVKTASDYTAYDLTTPELEKIQAEYSDVEDIYSLTGMQEGLLYYYQLDQETTSYVIQTIYDVKGKVEEGFLKKALYLTALRHEVLRTAFVTSQIDKPRQVILKNREIEYEKIDFTRLSGEDADRKLEQLKRQDIVRGFDLEKDALLRMKQIKLPDGKVKFMLSFHHIIMDGWCLSLVVGDFLQYYKLLLSGTTEEEIRKKIAREKETTESYGKYIENSLIQNREESISYWKELLEDYEGPSEMKPIKDALPCEEEVHVSGIRFKKELNDALKKLAAQNQATVNTVLETAWGIVLQKFNHTKDSVFGKIISGRNAKVKGIEQMVGLFINAIPVRVQSDGKTVNEIIRSLQKQGNQSDKYGNCALADVQNLTLPGKELIQTLFVFENYYVDEEKMKADEKGLTMTMDSLREQTNYDITVSVMPMEDSIQCNMLYNPSKFQESDIQMFLEKLECVLYEMVKKPDQTVEKLSILTDREAECILGEFNQTETKYPKDKTIADLFEEQVMLHPDKTAVVYEGEERESVTYDALNQMANQVAEVLLEQGVGADMPVAVFAEKGTALMAGILGILKAGGAYVPIDPTYPKERKEYMLADLQPKAILAYKTEEAAQDGVMDLSEILKEKTSNTKNPVRTITAENLAYIIYTSGTTGKPKGSMIEQKSVVRLVKETNYLEFHSDLVILQTGSMSFDASTFEVWGALLNGGKLVLVESETITDAKKLSACMEKNAVNTMWLTSTLFNQMLMTDQAMFDGLTNLLIGGEKLSEEHVRMFKNRKNGVRLINGYGPTEGTTFTTTYQIPENFSMIPIGKAISNTKIYILEDMSLCGIGVPGELCIAGDGVSRGYLNQPELNQEKFVKNPYGEGMLYRSGDLARWMEDGNIEYLGRMDEQVKIRGFRIEPGEIETVLLRMEGITDAAVIVKANEAGEKAVYAYFTAEKEINLHAFRKELRTKLPDYMLPSYMMQIEKIPVTTNGKLDRRALPDINEDVSREIIKPRNQMEELLFDIFTEILGMQHISVTDNFFDLGGHSLRAARMSNKIAQITGKKVALREILANATIEQLAELITGKKAEAYEPIPKAKEKEEYDMSSPQKRTFLLSQIEENSIIYNMPYAFEISKTIDIDQLKSAWETVINRHEILRTSFLMKEGRMIQRLEEKIVPDFEVIDAEKNPITSYSSLIQPFDLTHANTVRMKVIKEDTRYVLFVDMHHIVGDGMSFVTFLKEIGQAYDNGSLIPLKRQYRDYSEWMKQRDLSKQENFWRDCYKELPEAVNMPLDYTRPTQESFEGKMIYETFDKALCERIKQFAKEQDVTEYMVVLSALMILISKYARQDDIVVGSPVSARTHKDTESMLGMFVNTLAMRGNPKGEKVYVDFLKEIKEHCLKAFENQEYPFEELVECLEVERDTSRNPLFDIMLVFQNNETMELELNGEKAKEVKVDYMTSKFDLTFAVSQKGDAYEVAIEYATKLYKESSVRRMAAHLRQILSEVIVKPQITIEAISMITDWEENLILGEFNSTDRTFSNQKLLIELFEESVEKHKGCTAVIYEEEQVTYEQLNEMANVLAHQLIALGIHAKDRVAVMTDRSIEMMAAIFGVLKASAVYVPIDKNYPSERISYILEDSTAKAIIEYHALEAAEKANKAGVPIISLEKENWKGNTANPVKKNVPEDLAYIIYTSGTTGQPKGVMVENHSVVNLLEWMQEKYPMVQGDVILQKTTYSFDVSVSELFWWYLFGGSLVMLRQGGEKEPEEITKVIEKNKVSMIDFVPTMLSAYLADLKEKDERIKSLKYVIAAGEALNIELVKAFYEKCYEGTRLLNLYGPTEDTVYASWYDCEREEEKVPIGRPVGNGKLYVVADGTLCGIGVPGELWIGGEQVARGYLNKPELTKEKFIKNPFGTGRIYRSGDLVRWLEDGNIEYYGRIDEQVKVRGFRIELGEVEKCLRMVNLVTDAAVIAKADKNGVKAIYGYFTANQALDVSEVKKEMAKRIPDYMVPAYMMQIDKIPITGNGKLNRRALPEIQMTGSEEYVAPKNEMQKQLCDIFAEILGVHRVGITDSFFELGGDSIKAIRCVSKARACGIRLTAKDILQGQNVDSISDMVADTEQVSCCQDTVTGTVKETPILRTFQNWNLAEPNHFNQSMLVQVLESPEIVEEACKEVMLHHDMLRAVYRDGELMVLDAKQLERFSLETVSLLGKSLEETKKEVLSKCEEIQAGIDLENGPFIKAAYFSTDSGSWVFLCIHHLVVDGVSWRILLEDFEMVREQLSKHKPVKLPQKTTSFMEFSKLLEEYKNTEMLKKEKPYWDRVSKEAMSLSLHFEMPKEVDQEGKRYETIRRSLPKEETEAFLQKAAKIYHVKMDEVLLSAMLRAINAVTGQRKAAVILEGHGREEIHKKVDIDRTVGWFTTMYPVVLECHADLEEGIIATKETMRKVPNHGFGYGLLKEEELPVEIAFNYLGEMSDMQEEFSVGPNISEQNRLPEAINMNSWITGGHIVFEFSYEKARYDAENMNEFLNAMEESLWKMAGFLKEKERPVMTASDYQAKDLTTQELARIREKHPNIKEIYSLTGLQEGMACYDAIALNNAMEGKKTGYVIQSIYELKEKPDIDTLKMAAELLAVKHEVLRTAIVNTSVMPRQVILTDRTVEFTREECNEDITIEAIGKKDVERGFDLEKDSLFRMKEVSSKKKDYLILTFHHIIMDGWCMSLIFQDLLSNYEKLKRGIPYETLYEQLAEKQKKALTYKDYIKWLEERDKEESIAYFETLLDGYEEPAKIEPMERPEPTEHTMERKKLTNSREVSEALERAARENKATMNTIMEAAWGILLQRYNHTDDVVFGKVVSGRNADLEGIENVVGLFVNTIPIRVNTKEHQTVRELIQQLQRQGVDGNSHDYVSLSDVQSKTSLGKELIKTIFAFENYYMDNQLQESDKAGLKTKLVSVREETEYAITISSHMEQGRLINEILYNPNTFTGTEIVFILERLEEILKEIALDQGQKVSDIKAVTKQEMELILEKFNDTKTEYPREKTIAEIFEEQADLYADKVALEAVGIQHSLSSVTYKQLDELANGIAWKLKAAGIKRDMPVVIMADASIEMIAGILGVIKAGGGYVPIDMSYPTERIAFMLGDCQPKAAITFHAGEKMTALLQERFIPVIDLEKEECKKGSKERPNITSDAESMAYIIYTSGTTGKPKGTVIETRGVIRLVKNTNYYSYSDNTVMMQTGSLAFDASTFQIWGPLLNGGKLILAAKEQYISPISLKKILLDKKVTTMFLTTSLFNQIAIVDSSAFASLDYVSFGGEKASRECIEMILLDQANKDLTLCNVYGPTEATSLSTYYDLKDYKKGAVIPIGKSLSNSTTYVMNQGQLCGIGIPGELCIGGDGVAREYLNRPDLTDQKFIPNPFGEGKLYLSGDLVRWMPDGNIEFLGRIDEQVKIRGFRIELAEIESVIRKIEYITDTAVIVREDASGEKAIYAYYTSDEMVHPKELKKLLAKEMPSYMLPSYMMQIEKIPINLNGKLDKKALPVIESVVAEEYQAPENETEERLCKLFEEILVQETVGRNDNFFDIGGHSLRATRLANRIEAEFQVTVKLKEIFENPTVERLAELLQSRTTEVHNAIPEAEEKECYEMSSSQKRIFMLLKIDGESTVYNMPHYMKLTGTVDYDKLKECFSAMLMRHEILRTAFTMKEEVPVQIIKEYVEPDFKILERVSRDNEQLEELVRKFDIKNANSVRMRVIPREDGCILFFDMHHIVGDGMSVYTYLKEFFALYNGEEGLLQPARQFKDYSEWMHARNLESQKAYWMKEFAEEPLQLNMPVDFKRTGQQFFEGDVFYGSFGKELSESIKEFTKKHKITDFMFFLSAVMILLSKYSRQEDIVVGTPVSARTHQDTESMLGMFVNTLAMRAYPKEEKTVLSLMEEVKESSLHAFENQEYPFEDLVKETVRNRDVSRNPLFDVMFAMQNNESMNFHVNGAKFELLETRLKTSKFELTYNVFEKQDEYGVALEYGTKLYTRESAERFVNHLRIVAAQMIEQEERPIKEVTLLSKEEERQILGLFNQSERRYSKDKTLIQLFEERVERYKGHVAVRHEDAYVTYGTLNEMANALAHKLRKLGIGQNDCVGLIAERSIEMIAGIFAILKAGGAYVPVDKNYPKERIQYMLKDCAVKAVLVYGAENTLSILEEMDLEVIPLNQKAFTGEKENLPTVNTAKDLAYLIYTSGTTGKPKGVMIEHRGAVNLIEWMQEQYPLTEKDVILQKTTYSFDVSITEIFWWYLCGASLVMLRQGAEKEPAEIAQAIERFQVTVVNFVPTMLSAYLTELRNGDERGRSLRYVLAAGEALSQELVREFYRKSSKQTVLANIYGPTEITVYASWYPCKADDLKVLIGKPVANTKLYVVKDGKLCGIGVPGELWIAGDGVARGYLNREELTKEKFVENPFGTGRAYRSGDLVRWLPDGNIEYFGRIDEQVKVRGFRIELGEIETTLRQMDEVDDAAVIVREDGNGAKAIYAYFTSKEALEVHEVKAYMAEKLPEYMVPGYMMQIEEIPITGNGKLDRRKLPEIELQSETEYLAPKTRVQTDLCRILEEVLGVKQVGIRDGFFELGGDSIKAIRTVSKLRESGYDLTVRDIMKNQTVEAISYVIDKAEEVIYEQGEVSGICKNLPIVNMFQNWKMKKPEHFNQSMVLKVKEYDTKCILTGLEEVAKYHDAVRSVFRNGAIEILPIADSRLVELVEFEIHTRNEMEEQCNAIQESMDLENGPLFKAAIFQVKEERYLMLCMHHLIVDGVSFRILVEDMEHAFEQVKAGKTVTFPKKTASYLEWCEALSAYKESEALKQELSYWKEVEEEAKEAFYEEEKISDEEVELCYETIDFTLEEEDTKGLLYDTQAAFHTEITEVLLTALGMAVHELTGQDKLAVGLEGHGREELPNKIAIDRTVGWFTSMYPVVIYCDNDSRNGLINNKEMMRRVPNHGIGYGLITNGAIVPAEIFFNYLGEMNAEEDDGFLVTGENSAKENRLPGVININCVVSNGKLLVSNIYDASKYEEEQMEDLLFAFEDALKELVAFCRSAGKSVLTKSDLEAKDLSTEDLELINSLFQD